MDDIGRLLYIMLRTVPPTPLVAMRHFPLAPAMLSPIGSTSTAWELAHLHFRVAKMAEGGKKE